MRFVHQVLNYRIVHIVNSSISTQPATLQQLIVMTKSRKYDEFKVWKPKARQHHRSDTDTIRNHGIVMSNSMETQSVSAPPKWARHYQKPMKVFVWHRNNTCIQLLAILAERRWPEPFKHKDHQRNPSRIYLVFRWYPFVLGFQPQARAYMPKSSAWFSGSLTPGVA